MTPTPERTEALPAEERLESGEVLFYPVAPFALPESAERTFLFAQSPGGLGHGCPRTRISWNCARAGTPAHPRPSRDTCHRG